MIRLTYTRNSSFAVLAAALAVLLGAGCGGGSDSNGSSGGGSISGSSGEAGSQTPITVESGDLSKAQFIKQADLICEDTTRKFEEEVQALIQNKEGLTAVRALQSLKPAQAKAFVNEVFIPTREERIDEVSSLGAPQGDEQAVTAILDAMQEGLNEARRQAVKFAHSPITSFAGFARSQTLAEAYGLGFCWQG